MSTRLELKHAVGVVTASVIATAVFFASAQSNISEAAIEHRLKQERRDRLRGLAGVGVGCIWGPQIDRERNEALQTAIELRLRSHGITVLPADEYRKVPGQPFLVAQIGGSTKPFANVSLKEDAVLQRDKEILVRAETWFMERSAGGAPYREESKAALLAVVDDFINDYLAANPRKP